MAFEKDITSGELLTPDVEKNRGWFYGWPMVILFAGMLVFTFHACTHMVAAGDTWVAMACGRHHSNHGVDTVEPFSANSHAAGPTEESIKKWPGWAQSIAGKFDIETVRKWHPTGWVNQNWLTHTTFYKLAKWFGGDGEYDFNYDALVYWKFFIFTLEAFFLYFFARLIGVSAPSAAGASAMALFIGRSFLDIRPACYANVLAALLLLIMALAVYKNYRYIWLVVPMTVFWANVHGGYIYIYLMMIPFIGLNFISIPFQNRFKSIGIKGIYHSIGAGFASFFAMVLFNPYHLTNLTHTFEISISKHAESWRSVNEWHPAFEMSNPVGSSWPFLFMFIIAWIVLAGWCICRFLKPKLEVNRRRRSRQKNIVGLDEWPKVDLAFIFIAALSVYMAVRSRRFIPIAAVAACPMIVLLLEQAVRMVLCRINYNKTEKLTMPSLPKSIRTGVIIYAALITVSFGFFWGAKFKRIYLDPWPVDAQRDSVFMRMTASNVKPFDVCQFIRDNELSGNMFNYWTEGGALAFGQRPDPERGKTPLQLFMDGRAQAAYDHSTFMLWRQIYAGGPLTTKPRQANRMATPTELKEIGDYLTEILNKRDIWVFVLPKSQFVRSSNPMAVNYFPIALSRHPDWVMLYIDDDQQLFANIKTDKGKELLDDVMSKKAKFPNEFSKNLTLGKIYLRTKDPKLIKEGFEMTKKAFEERQSQSAMVALVSDAMRRPPYGTQAREIVEDFVNDFRKRKDELSKEGGYAKKLESAYVACDFLSKYYKNSNSNLSKEFLKLRDDYADERRGIALQGRW